MPYAQSWLDWEQAAGGRSALVGTAQELKAQYDGLVAALAPMMPAVTENVDITEGDVEGVKYRTYTPKGESGPFPIAIWTHGGGYMLGDLNSDDPLCRTVAEQTKSAVVSIDYSLTPQHVWPTQLDDCMKVYRWAGANASKFKGDASKIYTIGGSAGGGLALQIANQVVRDPTLKPSLKGIVAMVPCTAHWNSVPAKYASKYTAFKDNATNVPVLEKASMDTFYEHLKVDPKDPNVFTILATDKHADFPPVYFTSCEYDPLRDDAYIMEDALKEAGVKTKHDHYKGMPHYFWLIPVLPESKTYVENLCNGIGWLQSQM